MKAKPRAGEATPGVRRRRGSRAVGATAGSSHPPMGTARGHNDSARESIPSVRLPRLPAHNLLAPQAVAHIVDQDRQVMNATLSLSASTRK